MEIDVVLNLYEDIQSDLQNGVIDVVLSGEPTSKQFDFHYIMDDPYVVLLPEKHPLAKSTALSLKDIKNEALIMPRLEN